MLIPSKFSRTILILITTLSTASIVFAVYFPLSGSSGTPHTRGSFFTNGSGNAGTISFGSSTPCGAVTAGLDGDRLTGTFCLQTLGKVTFNSDVYIIPTGGPADLFTVRGTASSNGGKIYFQSGSYNVSFDPTTKKLVGSAWNLGVGKIPFAVYIQRSNPVGETTTPTTPDPDPMTQTITNAFEGRVKVLGNIGSNSVFDTFGYSAGTKFNASLMNDTLNRIRKNVSLITRNIPSEFENQFSTTSFRKLDKKIIIVNKTNSLPTAVSYSNLKAYADSSVDSIIIIGGNLIINEDIINTSSIHTWDKPKGIIALKNDAGVGGNVIVTKGVKNIESSIFTEGSLYSGEDIGDLYNSGTTAVLSLSENAPNQLYIHGALVTRNTIGGSEINGTVCVYAESNCTPSQAVRYDLNYFRGFIPTDTTRPPSTRAYRDDSLDQYSVIIEIDNRLGTNPPPGF